MGAILRGCNPTVTGFHLDRFLAIEVCRIDTDPSLWLIMVSVLIPRAYKINLLRYAG